jgi:acyl-CoA synthetase (AMP-forming)/AMP-acid ligase II
MRGHDQNGTNREDAMHGRAEAAALNAAASPVDAVPRDYNFAADILERNLAAGRRDKVAFIDPRGRWTYGEVDRRARAFAQAMLAAGVRREERVLICLTDTIDWPTAFLGAMLGGMVAVPLNTLLTEDDYRYVLGDSRARALVVSDVLYAKFEGLIRSGAFPHLSTIVVSGTNAHGHTEFEALLANAPSYSGWMPAPTTRDDIAFWLYTSGSTGKPKGAVHVHADLRLTDDIYGGPTLGITEEDVCYSVAKLFFAYGLGNALTFPMSIRSQCSMRCRPFMRPSWPPPVRRRARMSRSGAASPPARRCRPRSDGAGTSATASAFSTALARPRCCTFSCPTGRATSNTAPPGGPCRVTTSRSSTTTARR